MGWPKTISEALKQPGGARFHKCALQVNPYDYLVRHSKKNPFKDESDYNSAVVAACKQHEIELIAVADHYRVKTSEGLLVAARKAGIHAFPGFEAVTKDGVHVLCIFGPNEPIDKLERIIGECGIHEYKVPSPLGKHDVTNLLDMSSSWKAVCIAAHIDKPDGLLGKLKGQSRIQAWRHDKLHAASIHGSIQDVPEGIRKILENKDPQHKRETPVGILNTNDVIGPDDLADSSSWCWIKMSDVSLDGLTQAFLDPESRIRLATDEKPEEHAEFRALTWQGGFLDGTKVHFNENLNVLIGGRGTGKSTIVESIRYVLGLDPYGDDARRAHRGIASEVLRSGTKISLLLHSHRPSPKEYLIERTIPNPPIVRDKSGEILSVSPLEVVPQIEVYGQHEISELTRSKEKLTRLLDRFVEEDHALIQRKIEVQRLLARSRSRVVDLQKESMQVTDRLAALPSLQETLKRYEEAGLEERFKERSLLVREERILQTAKERLEPARDTLDQLRSILPIDRAFLSKKSLSELPGREILERARDVLIQFEKALEQAASQIEKAIKGAETELASVQAPWRKRKQDVQERYEEILRKLQPSRVNGQEFIGLRQQIEQLRPLKEQQGKLLSSARNLESERRRLLAEWEDLKGEEFRKLDQASRAVSRYLQNRVRVSVQFAGNREPLLELLRDKIPGRLSESIAVLMKRDNLSLNELADACRAGKQTLAQTYQLPPAQAERLATATSSTLMAIEELDLPATTLIELNIASTGERPVWKDLDSLSTGQKATAVLLLLLLESDSPLVVDQPEDDLDNRFITEGIVPSIRKEKRNRQFVFATHNANIPVLGDAELILGLQASGEAAGGMSEIPIEHMGSIDARAVRELVEDLLEGGKEAFEMRRLKYGY